MEAPTKQNYDKFLNSICPYTGAPITTREDWTKVLFGKDYRVSVTIINGNILSVTIKGTSSIKVVTEATKFTKSIIEATWSETDQIIYIGDFSAITSLTKEVRSYYIEYLKSLKQLHTFILCTQSSFMAITCKLGKKLNTIKFDFAHEKDYSSAIQRAFRLSVSQSTALRANYKLIKKSYPTKGNTKFTILNKVSHTKKDINSFSEFDWIFKSKNYSITFEILKGNIIHKISEGFIEIEHIPKVYSLQKKILLKYRLNDRPYYIINNVEKLQKLSLKARKKYIFFFSEWVKEFPNLQFVATYGANRILQAGLNISLYMKPFSMIFASSLSEAISFIKKYDASKINTPFSFTRKNFFRKKTVSHSHYADELNHFLCNIDWEKEGTIENLSEKSENHPFKSVYDAMVLIKADIDELFHDRTVAKKQIHQLTQELIKAQENERQRIARDLHDNVAQDLASLIITSDTIFDDQINIPPLIKEKTKTVSNILRKTIGSIRDLVYDLRPPGLTQMGVVKTMDQYCQDFSQKNLIEIDFYTAGLELIKLDIDTKINLFRILQEALNNVKNHADASLIKVRLIASYPNLILRIEDNGYGFDPEVRMVTALQEKRMGLKSMEERVKLLDGNLSIRSRLRAGTKIIVKFPCHPFLLKKTQ